MMKKRILFIALVLTLCLALAPTAAFAADVELLATNGLNEDNMSTSDPKLLEGAKMHITDASIQPEIILTTPIVIKAGFVEVTELPSVLISTSSVLSFEGKGLGKPIVYFWDDSVYERVRKETNVPDSAYTLSDFIEGHSIGTDNDNWYWVGPSGRLVFHAEGEYLITFEPGDSEPSFVHVKVNSEPSEQPATPATPLTARPTSSSVLVNGESVAFEAYNINDNNYFKLRDLAYALSGTAKQFEVSWDGANNAIALTSGKAYTPVGGEMTDKGSGNKQAAPTSSKITIDGAEVSLTAYNIEGNNYFKLRDIGSVIDFGITWDGANNAIVINTSEGYTPE
jgi:hypothetical protein